MLNVTTETRTMHHLWIAWLLSIVFVLRTIRCSRSSAHYQRGTKLTRDLHAAQAMRSHHGRNGRLRDLLKSNGVPEPAQNWSEAPAVIEWTNQRPATVRGSQASLF